MLGTTIARGAAATPTSVVPPLPRRRCSVARGLPTHRCAIAPLRIASGVTVTSPRGRRLLFAFASLRCRARGHCALAPPKRGVALASRYHVIVCKTAVAVMRGTAATTAPSCRHAWGGDAPLRRRARGCHAPPHPLLLRCRARSHHQHRAARRGNAVGPCQRSAAVLEANFALSRHHAVALGAATATEPPLCCAPSRRGPAVALTGVGPPSRHRAVLSRAAATPTDYRAVA